jgi:hypothetical protein
MDCTAAREYLDVASRRAGDDSELAAAMEHVRTCPACAEQVRSHQRFDDAVAMAMRDVAIPEGLKDRLLASVSPATVVPLPPVLPSRRGSRRWLGVAACVASIAMAVGAWQFIAWQRRPRPFDLAKVREAIRDFIDPKTGQIDLSRFDKFDESFNAKALARWLESVDLKGINIDRRGGDDGAMTLVQIGRDPRSVAVLLMIPASRLLDAPALASQANVSYSPLVAHAVMRDGGYVYVYCTPPNNLDDLRRLVQGVAA